MDSKKIAGIFLPRTSFYLWVILLLILVITFLNWHIAIPGYVLLAFLVFYNARSGYRRQKEITGYIENLTLNIDTATKDTLLNFPMPLAVTELDGTIVWYNSSFRSMFDGKELLEKSIDGFFEDFELHSLISERTSDEKQVTANGRHYKVLYNPVKIDKKSEVESYIILLYFFDITDMVEVKKKYTDEKIVTSLIIIDNYDDLMQSMEDGGRPQMLAEIEKKDCTVDGIYLGDT